MDRHRIGVISDTHGILRPETAAVLRTCEFILHAGDVGKPEVLRQLREIRDVYAVRGNVDSGRIRGFYAREAESQDCAEDAKSCAKESKAGQADKFEAGWAELPEHLPEELEVELFGFRIYMIHDRKQIRKDLSEVDLIICGHSHKYEVGRLGNTVCLNPGSCGPRRFRLPVTMMLLTLYPDKHRLETERIDCLDIPATGKGILNTDEEMEIPKQDMYGLIRQIIKDVDTGRRIAEIAARNHIDERFTEQVCRMYLTHPGVDVDGILDRLERKNL